MKFEYFHIKNFRGIESVRLDLVKAPRAKVHTLVGLNESGKTTILEAINYFAYKDETLDPLELDGYSVDDVHSLIPIARRSNFNDTVEILVSLSLDHDEEQKIKERIKKELGYVEFRDIGKILITQKTEVDPESWTAGDGFHKPQRNCPTCPRNDASIVQR